MKWFAKKKDSWQLAKITRDDQVIGTRLFNSSPTCRRKDFPHLVYFTLKYEGSGLPSKSDFARFDEFENILESVAPKLGIETIAVMTMNGKRDWVMYVKDGQAAVNGLFREMAKFEPTIETMFDPKWQQFKDLESMN